MTTPLHSTLKRALMIDGRDYVVTLTNATLKLTLKGKRNGVELPWNQLVNGEAALAVALNASVGAFTPKSRTAPANNETAAANPKSAAANDKTAPLGNAAVRREGEINGLEHIARHGSAEPIPLYLIAIEHAQ